MTGVSLCVSVCTYMDVCMYVCMHVTSKYEKKIGQLFPNLRWDKMLKSRNPGTRSALMPSQNISIQLLYGVNDGNS